MNVKKLSYLHDGLVFALVILYLAIFPIPITVNDDAYVYFTYARNFAEGRPFAYDPRNIPSEGFTSILYMLLIVPAELLDINPFFFGVLINMTALALSVVWIGQTIRAMRVMPEAFANLFTLFLAVLVLNDQSIPKLVYAGFESVFSLLWATGMIVSVAKALDAEQTERARKRWQSVFFVMAFLAHLVRPEYLLIGGLCGAILLWRAPERAALLRRAAIFVLVMVGYYLLKLAIFGDPFPTGFYRKVRSSQLGIYIIRDWTVQYKALIVLAGLFSGALLVTLGKRAAWLLASIGGALSICVFYLQSTPLAPFYHRFLITPIWVVYITLAFGPVWWVTSGAQRVLKVQRAWLLSAPLSLILIGATILAAPTLGEGNFYQRVIDTVQQHLYLRAGSYWRSQLSDPSAVTVVFGDAGAVPYALGSRFIDPNGLTEPPIAHLFRLPDGEEKTERFVAHVLSNQPDIIIDYQWYWYQPQEGEKLSISAPVNFHSPFQEQMPAAIYEAYRDYGMLYGCSVQLYVRMLILIRRDSPYGAENLYKAFCSYPGAFRFAEELVVHSEGRAINFPPYVPEAAAR